MHSEGGNTQDQSKEWRTEAATDEHSATESKINTPV
jgi:hypothetical protein